MGPRGEGILTRVDPVEVALEVAAAFERAGVPYLIGGGLASAIWGEPRTTMDVDLVADLDLDHVDPLVAALGDRFVVDAGAVRRAIRGRSMFHVLHRPAGFKIDVYPVREAEGGKEEMKRRRRERLRASRAFRRTLPDPGSAGGNLPAGGPRGERIARGTDANRRRGTRGRIPRGRAGGGGRSGPPGGEGG